MLLLLIVMSGYAIIRTSVPPWYDTWTSCRSVSHMSTSSPSLGSNHVCRSGMWMEHLRYIGVSVQMCEADVSRWIWAYWMSPFAWSLRAVAINEMSSPPRGQAGMAELDSFGFQRDRWHSHLHAHVRRLCLARCHIETAACAPEELPVCRA